MAYHYFLSSARLDRDNDPHRCISRFFEDFDQQLRYRLGVREGPLGFFDSEGIEPGDLWPETLGAALRSCGALICLYSPAYFDSEYCGKIWSVFESRLSILRSPLILPVLFDPPEDLGPLLAGVADVQYEDDDYPQAYLENGLRYLMVRERQDLKARYREVLDALVERLKNRLENYNLPPLPELPAIKSVPSFFHPKFAKTTLDANRQRAVPPVSGGPRYVSFIFVAAQKDEMRSLKRNVESYGEEGGLDWKPFWPGEVWDAALLTQSVATKEGFRYQVLPLSNRLAEQVAEARSKSTIVILLVDAWTLRLSRYHEIVREYDAIYSWNSAVVVVWNPHDEETSKERAQLEAVVREAFITKSRRAGKYFVDCSNVAELDSLLGVLLQRLKVDIIEISEDLRAVPSDIQKPEILAPAGGTAS